MDKVNSKFKIQNSPPKAISRWQAAEKIKNKDSKIKKQADGKARSKKVWVRVVPLAKATREWDIDFWQAQKPTVRFLAAWDMIADFYRIRGKRIGKNTLRLQRTVESVKQA